MEHLEQNLEQNLDEETARQGWEIVRNSTGSPETFGNAIIVKRGNERGLYDLKKKEIDFKCTKNSEQAGEQEK